MTALQLQENKSSPTPLLLMVGAMIAFQVIILLSVSAFQTMIAVLIIVEIAWAFLIVLMIRSLHTRMKDWRNRKDAFLSTIRVGDSTDYDTNNWYQLKKCPDCGDILSIRKFSPPTQLDVWDIKHCDTCKKVVGKKLIVHDEVIADD